MTTSITKPSRRVCGTGSSLSNSTLCTRFAVCNPWSTLESAIRSKSEAITWRHDACKVLSAIKPRIGSSSLKALQHCLYQRDPRNVASVYVFLKSSLGSGSGSCLGCPHFRPASVFFRSIQRTEGLPGLLSHIIVFIVCRHRVTHFLKLDRYSCITRGKAYHAWAACWLLCRSCQL